MGAVFYLSPVYFPLQLHQFLVVLAVPDSLVHMVQDVFAALQCLLQTLMVLAGSYETKNKTTQDKIRKDKSALELQASLLINL